MQHDDVDPEVVRAMRDLCFAFYSDDHDHFSVQVFKLFAKADETNQQRLGLGFPHHYKAWCLWKSEPDTLGLLTRFGLDSLMHLSAHNRKLREAQAAARPATAAFKKGDRVVYETPHGKSEDGSVTSINDAFVFVCFGLPGSTSQACHPSTLQPLLGDADE